MESLTRYLDYKANTARLVNWLAATAAACGHGNPTDNGPFSARQIKAFAEAINAKTPAVEIPGTIIELADLVIAEREAVSASYAVPGHETAEDRSHWHFNETLREVRSLLQGVRARRRSESGEGRGAARREPRVSANAAEDLECPSIYSHLEVEEPSLAPFSRPKKKRPRTRQTPRQHGQDQRGGERRRWVWWCSLM